MVSEVMTMRRAIIMETREKLQALEQEQQLSDAGIVSEQQNTVDLKRRLGEMKLHRLGIVEKLQLCFFEVGQPSAMPRPLTATKAPSDQQDSLAHRDQLWSSPK